MKDISALKYSGSIEVRKDKALAKRYQTGKIKERDFTKISIVKI